MTSRLSRGWKLFLLLALVAGCLLRFLYVQDMEWKEDEQLNFNHAVLPGMEAFPWVGMPSGVYVPNPGMSYWVFAALARVFRVTHPTELAHAVQLFALLGMSLVIPFALRFIQSDEEREPWLWAFALSMVNPFNVLYQRKLWPEGFLPFFTMLTLMGWWKRRDGFAWAFLWGMIGAWLGQIHMSGFFFAFGIVAWTLLFEERPGPRWKLPAWFGGWFAGSVAGALPLIPWLLEIIRHPTPQAVGSGWGEALQLKFWVFWLTNPTGLHLGNPLGLLRGQTTWAQISDFVRYPLVGGHATYLNLAAHALALGAATLILARGALWVARKLRGGEARELLTGRGSPTAFLQSSALWGFGLTMTATTINIRRYYMMVDFPLEMTFLARVARNGWGAEKARRLLAALWAAELFMSACFVGYVHVNGGAEAGDYGVAYHRIAEDEAEARTRGAAKRPSTNPAGTAGASGGSAPSPATPPPER